MRGVVELEMACGRPPKTPAQIHERLDTDENQRIRTRIDVADRMSPE